MPGKGKDEKDSKILKDIAAKDRMRTLRERDIKSLISREYKLYRRDEREASLPRSIYEKACNASVRILKVSPDPKTREKLDEAIRFAHINTTPDGIISFTFLFMLLTLLPTLAFMTSSFLGYPGLPVGYGTLIVLMCLFFTYYLYYYPLHLKKKYEMQVGSDIVTMMLYIVMYMRNTPNLEGAMKFAADNIPGDLGYELKKLFWDVEVGNYLSMEEALLDYTNKWQKNRPFVESVQLIITSMRQAGPRRELLLEEAVKIILEGNREDAKIFNQKLKLPVTVVNALGIVLPVMGLVFFPIVAVFLKVEALLLFVGYDIILPFMLYFIINNIMEIRPATFSKIDISQNPDAVPKGMFKHGDRNLKAWPFAVAVALIFISLGVYLYFAEINDVGQENFEGIYSSIAITMGIAFGFATYYILISGHNLKIRQETRQIETEFAEALFQLGSQVQGGTPIEVSMGHSLERINNLKIKQLFSRAMNNMKMLGLTFQQAFFDEKYGATIYYPSRMIKSIMRTVVEASRKGVKVAAGSMMTISRYLKDLHSTQEEIQESLSDTLNSLKFQAYFLTPMISGVVGTLAIIIIQILRGLSTQAAGLGTSVSILDQFANIPITPFQFIIIVSIYMIETSFVLGIFINAIENGDDDIGRQNITGHTLLIGYIVFAVCLIVTLTIFKPLISSAGIT